MKKVLFGLILGIVLSSFTVVLAQEFTANTVSFPILINGKKFESEKPAVVINGSTYLPLRAIGEALNKDILWDEENSRVLINDKKLNTETPTTKTPISTNKSNGTIKIDADPVVKATFQDKYCSFNGVNFTLQSIENNNQNTTITYSISPENYAKWEGESEADKESFMKGIFEYIKTAYPHKDVYFSIRYTDVYESYDTIGSVENAAYLPNGKWEITKNIAWFMKVIEEPEFQVDFE